MSELLFRDDAYLKTATARVLAAGERGIELDRTVFYPQGGGQAGDSGTLLRASGERLAITDTRKGEAPDRVLHIVAPGSSLPQPGEAVALEIDLQPCGGTHVANIAEIGGIRVLRIRSEGRHNKRVEIALTGSG